MDNPIAFWAAKPIVEFIAGLVALGVVYLYFGGKGLLMKFQKSIGSSKFDIIDVGQTRYFISKQVFVLTMETATEQNLLYPDNVEWLTNGVFELRAFSDKQKNVGVPGDTGRIRFTLASNCIEGKFGNNQIMLKPEWVSEKI